VEAYNSTYVAKCTDIVKRDRDALCIDRSTATDIAAALVSSRLDYANSVLCGLPWRCLTRLYDGMYHAFDVPMAWHGTNLQFQFCIDGKTNSIFRVICICTAEIKK